MQRQLMHRLPVHLYMLQNVQKDCCQNDVLLQMIKPISHRCCNANIVTLLCKPSYYHRRG